MDGLLVVDKPAGLTSHDVVARVRRTLRERRIGHTGTLDPMATGVLPLVLGRATRLARFLSAGDKIYEAVIRFGFSTTTGDAEGTPVRGGRCGSPATRDAIDRALDAFRGTFLQQPPAYSAKKIGGTRSHTLARARARLGSDPNAAQLAQLGSDPIAGSALPAPASVTVSAIDVVSLDDDQATLTIHCSAGFYVRSLAHDLGEQLGVGAHLARLRRTRSGDFTEDEAVALERLEADPEDANRRVIPMAGMLRGWPAFTLTTDGVRKARHGRDVGPGDVEGHEFRIPSQQSRLYVRLMDSAGELLAIGEPAGASGLLHPTVVLV